jgi:hypothetical protein
VNHLQGEAMPKEIDKILELAKPPVVQTSDSTTISKSARFSWACGLMALGSVIIFWLMLGWIWILEKGGQGGNAEELFLPLLVTECCLLPGLSTAAVIAAIVGLVGAKRQPGNRKVAIWAIVLTVIAVAGFLAPIIIYISSHQLIHF